MFCCCSILWPVTCFHFNREAVLLSPGLEIAAIRAIRKGWKNHTSNALSSIVNRVRAGLLGRDLLLPAMHHLGEVATESPYPAILYGLTAGSPDLRADAYRAVQAAYRHLFRLRAYGDLLELYERLREGAPIES